MHEQLGTQPLQDVLSWPIRRCLVDSPLRYYSLQGAIDVQQLEVRYRPDLDPVLKGISFSVRGREKASLFCRQCRPMLGRPEPPLGAARRNQLRC